MSSGPIEFLGEGAAREVPTTEYGGADGLIQPSPEEVGLFAADGMKIGHDLTPSESSALMGRSARVPLVGREQTTGESATGEVVTDPVTGRVAKPEELGQDVSGKKGKEHGLSDLRVGN